MPRPHRTRFGAVSLSAATAARRVSWESRPLCSPLWTRLPTCAERGSTRDVDLVSFGPCGFIFVLACSWSWSCLMTTILLDLRLALP